MKTIEEKAEEYSARVSKGKHFMDLQLGFYAGYKAAFEWIRVDDELPKLKDKPYPIIATNKEKTTYDIFMMENQMEIDIIISYYPFWRPINND